MMIDEFYSRIDKSNFYLGMISQVFKGNSIIQVENLSLLSHRKIRLETLIPNTINYLVVIDSVQGLFIGEVYQAKVNTSDSVHESMNNGKKEAVFPEISVDVIGLLAHSKKFELAGFKTVGITDKVYIANEKLVKEYINSIEINTYTSPDGHRQVLLKNLARIAEFNSEYLSLHPNTLFDRHLMAIGTTNSGKSTSALSILDKLFNSERKILLIDPTGEYKESFDEDDSNMVKLTLGKDTVLPIGKISMRQWAMIFQTNDGTQETELTKAVKALRYQNIHNQPEAFVKLGEVAVEVDKKMAEIVQDNLYGDFALKYLPKQIMENSVKKEDRRNANYGKYIEDTFYEGVNRWLSEKVANVLTTSSFENFVEAPDSERANLLDKIDNFIADETSSLYIDASEIGVTDGIGTMIIDLISKHIIEQKKLADKPFVMYVDEVHRYTQMDSNYHTGLESIAREGRKKGIFLFLTTQNPKDVPETLLGQVGSLIIHRLTHSDELNAIQNQVQVRTLSQIQNLNQGEAILTSINLLQDVQVRFEKCNRRHINDTPIL